MRAFKQKFWFRKSLTLLLRLKSCSARGASHHPIFMRNCPTSSHTFLVLSTQWMSFSFRETRKWSQSKISSHYFCLWYKSRELRDKGNSRFPCVTPVVETLFIYLLIYLFTYLFIYLFIYLLYFRLEQPGW